MSDNDKLKEQIADRIISNMRPYDLSRKGCREAVMSALTDYDKSLASEPKPLLPEKVQHSEQSQEWTPHWIFQQACKTDGYRILSDAHNAALAAANRIAPWHDPEVKWMCEQHPNLPFEHDDCAGPGVPFKNGVEVKAPNVEDVAATVEGKDTHAHDH